MSGDPRTLLEAALSGRYRLERELGRGGMATVYLAQDLRHDRPVALKVLHPELAVSLGADRFLREIRLAARLQHPHILTVLDSGEIPVPGAPSFLWFTMPFIRGESLRDRLKHEAQLPVEDALRITREAADALAYAHGEGVIHRDIKPENILLTGTHALVADFGIARALGDGEESLTQTGLSVGTPAYMSPEQAAGNRELDARTDIYSLAVVLYEMLAGETPFAAPTPQAMLARRFTETPRPVRQLRDAVPEPVEQALQQALARTPADRFASAAQFAAALDLPRMTGGTVAAEAVSGPRPESRPARRPVPLAAVTLVLGLVIGLGVLFAWRRSHLPGEAGGSRVLAVLPFENLGDSGDAYFATGVTDEVRGKLASLAGLEVIARSSSNDYQHSEKGSEEIARELGADYLLTGTVRWEKIPGGTSRVRVIPELVEVRPGRAPRTRWQESYDAALTNVFEVQAGIAAKVASALGVALADSVRNALAAQPTASLAAYDAFLQGEAASQGLTASDVPSLRRAVVFYHRAVGLDSAFVPAWARVSQAYSQIYSRSAPTSALAQQALEAAERARALAPDRPEGYLALGEYYRGVLLDYARALATFEAGLRLAPNHVDLLAGAGFVEQYLGRWESSQHRFRRAAGLDPRSANAARRYAFAFLVLHRYAEADAAFDRAIALAPTDIAILQQKVMVSLARGDLDGARRVLRAAPAAIDRKELIAYFGNFEDLWWLLDDAQQRQLLTLPPSAFDDDRGAWGLVLAQTHHHRGDLRQARIHADSAVLGYSESVRAAPNDGQLRVLLGLSLAYAGRHEEAAREGERGVELQPIARDAYNGPYIQQQLARIYMMAGRHEEALDQLEPLVRVPHNLSPGWLRIDPTWDPLRKHPRFQRLVAAGAS